ncbi:MAG: PIG-L deacetylase family protein [Candidatus Woesearchaeota archaeon]
MNSTNIKKIKKNIKKKTKTKKTNNNNINNKKETVLIFCAHNDDHTLGAGGTIAKYSKEGINVVVVIFSYGENSHIWLKKEESIKMRVLESKKADKLLGIKKTYYYGLKDGFFSNENQKKKIIKSIKRIIAILKPSKIFTHSFDDPHPDHKTVYYTISQVLEEINYNCDVYSFDIWNPFNLRKRDSPKLFVDITDTFKIKMKSFSLHKSQWMTKIIMIPTTYTRGLINGLERGIKYAEVFYKIK